MIAICFNLTTELDTAQREQAIEMCIASIAQGDKAALSQLYETTKSSVYGFALSMLKHPQDAEDVLQDTYLQVYRGAKSYQPQGKPMAYIITITRNLCLMKFRQDKKTTDIPEDMWATFFAENEGLTADDSIALNGYMMALSTQERQIVSLYAISGFKHREIAEILQMPLSTVLSKYNRALKKLKKYYTEGENI
ncbi:MAG: RNA polymerase sigma factor [Oscillospiraceae bacterium]